MTEQDEIAAVFQMRPLLRVALYLDIQSDACLIKGRQIKAKLDEVLGGDASEPIDASGVNELHREFWFWVLGAYEFSRTLADQKARFTPEIGEVLRDNLTFFTLLRVPFAKLRQAGTKGARTIDNGAYLSIVRVVRSPADMFFRITSRKAEHVYGMRTSIDRFEAFVATINDAIRAMPEE